MIVDPSAIVAILLSEPEREPFLRLLSADPTPCMSVGGWVELAAAGTRRFRSQLFDEIYGYVQAARITLVPVTIAQGRLAHDAYRQYGLGSLHPAKLNFGDCFSYALAKESGEPLLFKGDNFTHTDITRAI